MSFDDLTSGGDNDLGIWICDASGFFISHALLMKSICSNFPDHVSVKFASSYNENNKYFRKSNPVEFYYCKYERAAKGHSSLRLFGIGEAASSIFVKECNLSDLQFPVRMAGIILITAKRTIDLNYLPVFEIDWAKKQNMPIVIAATGYNDQDAAESDLRPALNLDVKTRVVSGPAIDIEQGNGFDESYAHRLLGEFG